MKHETIADDGYPYPEGAIRCYLPMGFGGAYGNGEDERKALANAKHAAKLGGYRPSEVRDTKPVYTTS